MHIGESVCHAHRQLVVGVLAVQAVARAGADAEVGEDDGHPVAVGQGDYASCVPFDDVTDEPLMKVPEAQRMLNVSGGWLYDAAKAGRIPHVRLGGPDGPLRFVRSDLEDYIDDARRGGGPTPPLSAGSTRRAGLRRAPADAPP